MNAVMPPNKHNPNAPIVNLHPKIVPAKPYMGYKLSVVFTNVAALYESS